jgi:hypothetical protein
MAALVLCWRLTESDVTTCHQSHVWIDYVSDINHVADVIPPSTSLAFVTKMSVKHKSTSPNAVTVKSQQHTIRTVEKLHAPSHLVKHEQIVDICHNVRFAHGGICTIGDNAERTTESAKSETKASV